MSNEINGDMRSAGGCAHGLYCGLVEDTERVTLTCPFVSGVAAKCRGVTVESGSIQIRNVHVTAMALLVMHAGLPVGQLFSHATLHMLDGSTIDLSEYRLDHADFKPMYVVPFVIRRVTLTKIN